MESNDWMIYGYPHDLGNLHLTILRDVPDTEHLIEVLSCDFLHAHLRMVLNVPRGWIFFGMVPAIVVSLPDVNM